MPQEDSKISVVISCYNEEGNVKRFKDEIIPFLTKTGLPYELIIVDDGSTDNTYSVIQELAENHSVIPLKHPTNRGLGSGLRTAFDHCTGDIIVTLDADLTFHPREMENLLGSYDDQTDIVAGSPFLGKLEGVSIHRRILSKSVNLLYRVFLGIPMTAVSSIFRLYKASALRSLNLTSESFDINAEIIFKALQQGKRIKEIPVVLTQRTWGKSKIGFVREIKNHFVLFGRILKWRFIHS